MPPLAGAARVPLTPFWGVELAGWGYYLERTWERIHDDLQATALVVDDGTHRAAIVSLDLFILSPDFAAQVRRHVAEATALTPESVLVACTHSHSAPASGGLIGAGAVDPLYEEWAARQAATAVILAWRNRRPASLGAMHGEVSGVTYNRVREDGPVDPRLTVLRVDKADGRPLAAVLNFAAHPTVFTRLQPRSISRDLPGRLVDLLEAAHPGVLCLYLPGAAGDVNFRPEFTTADQCYEPAEAVGDEALRLYQTARLRDHVTVSTAHEFVRLPTTPWDRGELLRLRGEAERRLTQGDYADWRTTIGRAMTINLDEMVSRHGDEAAAVRAMCRFHLEWTERALADLTSRPRWVESEAQALRLGDVYVAGSSAELFACFGLELRRRAELGELLLTSYANGWHGYLPDAEELARRGYHGLQSPRFANQHPYTPEAGPAAVEGLLRVLAACRGT